MNKRFRKEIRSLYIQQNTRSLLENDYLVYQDESNINLLHTIIKAPRDSVYRHTFIRLDFEIPDNYPHSPPKVTFVNHDNIRIHPNMYKDGKCCSTILNTWPSENEKWTSSMGIETILLTFHSFLDNNPYTYEPGGRDDPSYTIYVRHQSWITCLIKYLQYEKIELFTEFMHNYLLLNIDSIFSDLYELSEIYSLGYYETRCFEIDIFPVNYSRISSILEYYYNYIEFQESHQISSFDEFVNMDYDCCICYDTLPSNEGTLPESSNKGTITLGCNHSFHKACLQSHIQANNNICPMCRRELIEEDHQEISTVQEENIWMINPLTRRRIKIGGRTYNYLKSNGEL